MSTTLEPALEHSRRARPIRIVLLDEISAAGRQRLDETAGLEYQTLTGLAGDALAATLKEFDGAIVRSGAKITAAVLEGNQRLRAIVRAGVGTDNIDKAAATRQGIVVMNTPSGNTLSTAEHTWALLLAVARNIPAAHASLVGGQWDRQRFTGTQLAGKTLAIIGMGRIGQEVALRGRAFGMRVVALDPFLPADRFQELHIERAESLDALLPVADFLTVHTPLNDETRGLIGAREMERLKPGARLVNCARGGIFDETALVEGLKSGRLAGVGLDVFATEPCMASPLFSLPGVVVTPHLGASTEEAQQQVALEAVELIVNYFERGQVRHAVNMSPIEPQTLRALRGHIDLAHRLGLLLGQWHGGGIARCQVHYQGQIVDHDTRLLTAAVCAGLAANRLSTTVNIVNAPTLLRERGTEVVELSDREMESFSSSITVTVEGDGQTRVAGGALFGRAMPRLVRLGPFRLEAYLDGNLLILGHRDVPGIIGHIGQLLAAANVNIGQMVVGRTEREPGGSAIGVLNLDSPPPAEVVEQVARHPDIASAQLLRLPPPGALPDWLA